jgi:hypothetical protein
MSNLKKYRLNVTVSVMLIFFATSCSENVENISPTTGIDTNLDSQVDMDISISSSSKSVRPGDFVILKANINRITKDSLSGVIMKWSSDDDNIKPVVQEPGIAAVIVPENYSKKEFKVTAQVFLMKDKNFRHISRKKQVKINIEKNKVQGNDISGYILHDTTWSSNKLYKLTRDLSIKNGAILTIKKNAIIDLNGHTIVSNDGQIQIKGTKNDFVKVILPGTIRVPNININYLKAITSKQMVGLTLNGKLKINNSKIYSPVRVDHGKIYDSRITAIYPFAVNNDISILINNCKIYYLSYYNINNLISLVIKNSNIFSTIFEGAYFIRNGNFIFQNNYITYLSIPNIKSGKFTAKNNSVSNLLFKESKKSLSIHQNNIGINKNGFFAKKQEPIFGHRTFNDLNSYKTKVTVSASGQYKVRELNLSNNYWAPKILKEMKQKGVGKNISFIYDYYDDLGLDKVIYKNWADKPFPVH